MQNLQPLEKEELYTFGKNGQMICKGNMSYFFKIIQEFSENCLNSKNHPDNRILEDTDFYEFWSIEIECSNQTISFPTH